MHAGGAGVLRDVLLLRGADVRGEQEVQESWRWGRRRRVVVLDGVAGDGDEGGGEFYAQRVEFPDGRVGSAGWARGAGAVEGE